MITDKNFATDKTLPTHCPIKSGMIVDCRDGSMRERVKEDMFSMEYDVRPSHRLLAAANKILEPGADAKADAEAERLHTQASFPEVYSFMMPVFCNDFSQLRCFQATLGYCLLTGLVNEKCIFWWYGPRTNNAKTSVIQIAEKLCGRFLYYGYVSVCVRDALEGCRRRSSCSAPVRGWPPRNRATRPPMKRCHWRRRDAPRSERRRRHRFSTRRLSGGSVETTSSTSAPTTARAEQPTGEMRCVSRC